MHKLHPEAHRFPERANAIFLECVAAFANNSAGGELPKMPTTTAPIVASEEFGRTKAQIYKSATQHNNKLPETMRLTLKPKTAYTNQEVVALHEEISAKLDDVKRCEDTDRFNSFANEHSDDEQENEL
jgi:hypothetical protein